MLRLIVLVLFSSFFVFTRTTGLLHKKPTDWFPHFIIIKFQRSSNFLGASNQVANRGRRAETISKSLLPKKARRESLFLLFSENLYFFARSDWKNLINRHNKTKATRALLLQNIPLTPLLLSHRFAHHRHRTYCARTHTRLSLISLSLVEQ